MYKKIRKLFVFSIMVPLFILGMVSTSPLANSVFAADPPCSGLACAKEGATGSKGSLNSNLIKTVSTVVNILLFLIGLIAVIVLVIAGFRFVTANGDTGAVTSAKNTIIYAIIGIVVAFSAYAISSFVTGQLLQGQKTPVTCNDSNRVAIEASADKRCK